jgi:hypothetical protein
LEFANPHGETTHIDKNDFIRLPNKVVSMREFYAHHYQYGQHLDPNYWDRFSIQDGNQRDGAFDQNHLKIEWVCNQSCSGIMEMTFLIVGETV